MSIPDYDATHFWQFSDAQIKVTGKPLISPSISVFEAWIFERINYLFGVYNTIIISPPPHLIEKDSLSDRQASILQYYINPPWL